MDIVYKSATQARKEFFSLIQAAVEKDQVIVVTQRGKPKVRIMADKQPKIDWQEFDRAVKELRHLLTEQDFKDMKRAHDTFRVRETL